MVKLVVKLDLCATELNAEATLVQGQIFALHNNETTSVQKIKIGIGAQITGFTTGFTSTKVPILTREAWT